MNFDKTSYNLPVNRGKLPINQDKNVSKPDTSFQGTDASAETTSAKVNSSLAKAYLGIKSVSFKGKPETPETVFEPIKLVENKPYTPEEARKLLADKGYTDGDLANIDFNDKNLLENLNLINIFLRHGELAEYKDLLTQNTEEAKEFKAEIIKELANPDNVSESLKKYANDENIEILKKYVECESIDDEYQIIRTIDNDEDLEDILSALNILTNNGKTKIKSVEFSNLGYAKESELKSITPHKVDFVSKINSQIPEEYRLSVDPWFCASMEDDSVLTDELAEQYVKEINRFVGHRLSDGTRTNDGLVEKIKDMKSISDFLDVYPLELDENEKGLRSTQDVKTFMEKPNIKEITGFLSTLTPEAKKVIPTSIILPSREETSLEKWSEFLNFVTKDGVCGEKMRIEKLVEFANNIEDLDGFMDLIKAYQGTSVLNNDYGDIDKLNIANGDYKNAAKVLNEIRQLYDSINLDKYGNKKDFNTFLADDWTWIIRKEDIDYANIAQRFDKLKQSDIKLESIDELIQFVEGKAPDSFEKWELLKQNNFSINDYTRKYFIDNNDVNLEQLKEKFDKFAKKIEESNINPDLNMDIVKYFTFHNTDYVILNGILEENFDRCIDVAKSNLSFLEPISTNFLNDFWNNKDYPVDKNELLLIAKVLDKENIELANILCKDKDFPKERIRDIVYASNTQKQDLAELLCTDKELNFPKDLIVGILKNVNSHNKEIAKTFCTDKELNFPKDKIAEVIKGINEDNKDLATKLCTDKELNFPKEYIGEILSAISAYNKAIPSRLYGDKQYFLDEDLDNDEVRKAKADFIDFAMKLCADEQLDFPKDKIADILKSTNLDNIDFAKKLCTDKHLDFPKDLIAGIIGRTRAENKDFAEMLCTDKKLDFPKKLIADIVGGTRTENKDLAIKLCTDNQLDFPKEYISNILYTTNNDNKDLSELLCTDKQLDFPKELIARVLKGTNPISKDIANKLCTDKELNFPKELIPDILPTIKPWNKDIAKIICTDKELNFPKEFIENILASTNEDNKDLCTKLCTDKEYAFLPQKHIAVILQNFNKFTEDDIKRLKNFPPDFLESCTSQDIVFTVDFSEFYEKQNINELKVSEKKELLRRLVESNVGMFNISEAMHEKFPLIPRNQEEYCSLLPSIVRSLGIETKELSKEKVAEFNKSMTNLSESLAKISDNDFANLEITQEYSKDEFITDVLDKVKDLSPNEQQKVFDYFGFELKENANSSNGKYAIVGYPVNLNNGHKLAQIENPETKAIVEKLRPDVIRFSENNKIHCNNAQVEQFINEVVSVLPELRPTIGKKQHGNDGGSGHEFDIIKHTLKVMQKIAQDQKFQSLDESDKKIMLLASLLHDITKAEGQVDKTHAKEGSFDSFFIAKKFKLSKDEEIKLNTIIKNHEWLEYANTAKSDEELTKRLQAIAYDMHQSNLFDLAEIFTHADLRAVKKDDRFHDTKQGKSRVSYDGTVRSFGESTDFYAKQIRKNIEELKKSQPLLPQTPIPKASRINEAITQVNADGSTNIKGVYKNKDGLVILKYNEIEDWETIGFPKGSVSKGIKVPKGTQGDEELSEDVDTGNIKFFVHGLDYSNQLAKFDAFSLVDSNALLSVSYAERPESKYRFFRTQGVILDANPQYIHGGGNTDAGSGCGKDIDEFKRNYIFGGPREKDRLYVSNLIKKATGMSDEEYVKFFEKNKGKPLTEIEPPEAAEAMIKAFATINSNTRKGNRSYNEMYLSNPNGVMGVFAYSSNCEAEIGNPVEFVEFQKDFLKKYALERDIPFVVFGD